MTKRAKKKCPKCKRLVYSHQIARDPEDGVKKCGPCMIEQKRQADVKKPRKKTLNDIKGKRNKLLADSDKYMVSDYPITDKEREAWRRYRKRLRDMTQKKPYRFPQKPDQI